MLLAALTGSGLLLVGPQSAAEHAPIGTPVSNRELPALSGGRQPLLVTGILNVLVFFRAGQEHSRAGLEQMAQCERELSGRSLRFVAIAPAASDPEALRAEATLARIAMPVLVDAGDVLHGELGVYLHPVVALIDARSQLAVFEPFHKINYCDLVRAEIRHALGEISDADLEQVRNPPAAPGIGGDMEAARRQLKLGEALIRSGKPDKALAAADAALAKAPGLREARCLRARSLAALGRCPEAAEEAKGAACELQATPGCRP